jgi:hypothetical protein
LWRIRTLIRNRRYTARFVRGIPFVTDGAATMTIYRSLQVFHRISARHCEDEE